LYGSGDQFLMVTFVEKLETIGYVRCGLWAESREQAKIYCLRMAMG